MANLFTAQNNCTVRYIGLESAEADVDIEYSVYLLNENAESPVDGELFAEATEHFNYKHKRDKYDHKPAKKIFGHFSEADPADNVSIFVRCNRSDSYIAYSIKVENSFFGVREKTL